MVKDTSRALYPHPPPREKSRYTLDRSLGGLKGQSVRVRETSPPPASVNKQMGFEHGTMSCYGITTRLSLRTLSLHFALIAHRTIPKPSLTLLTSRLQSVVFPALASSDTKRHTIYITNRAIPTDLDML